MVIKRHLRKARDAAYDKLISRVLTRYYRLKLGSNRIFGVGLPKTGTTSLIDALHILGYSAIGYPRRGFEHWRFQASADTPVALSYRKLDREYPGSKFILTTRELGDWLGSCRRHFGAYFNNPLREALFGTYIFEEDKFRETYERHHREVFEYFKDRPQDLLVFNLIADPTWEPLCTFLVRPVPNAPFPWSNRAAVRA